MADAHADPAVLTDRTSDTASAPSARPTVNASDNYPKQIDASAAAAVLAFATAGKARDGVACPDLLLMLLHAVASQEAFLVWHRAGMSGPVPRDVTVVVPRWDPSNGYKENVVSHDELVAVRPSKGGFAVQYARGPPLQAGRKTFFAVKLIEDDVYVGVADDKFDTTRDREFPGRGGGQGTAWMFHAYFGSEEVAILRGEDASPKEFTQRGQTAKKGRTVGVMVDLSPVAPNHSADGAADGSHVPSGVGRGDSSDTDDDSSALTPAAASVSGGVVTFYIDGVRVDFDEKCPLRLPLDGRPYLPALSLGVCDACVLTVTADGLHEGISARDALDARPAVPESE